MARTLTAHSPRRRSQEVDVACLMLPDWIEDGLPSLIIQRICAGFSTDNPLIIPLTEEQKE